jgi:hypothetical protein
VTFKAVFCLSFLHLAVLLSVLPLLFFTVQLRGLIFEIGKKFSPVSKKSTTTETGETKIGDDMEDTTFYKTGTIQTRQGRKGVEFWAYNHQHEKPLHVGTLSGAVYEKTAPILHKPEPSFCLPLSELAAVEEAAGRFIRFIGRGRPGTFSISVEDFKLHGEKYFNASYGYQIRVALKWFAYTSKVGKRNPIIDNPVIEQSRPILRDRQPSLF